MKEHPSVLEQANRYVTGLESAYVLSLIQWEEDAEHRSTTCKCPTCLSEPNRAHEAVCTEVNRLHLSKESDQD